MLVSGTVDLAFCASSGSDLYSNAAACCSDGKSVCDAFVAENICENTGTNFLSGNIASYSCEKAFDTEAEANSANTAAGESGSVQFDNNQWLLTFNSYALMTEADCSAKFEGPPSMCHGVLGIYQKMG